MNYTKPIILSIALVIINFSSLFAQNALDDPYLNRSVLKHFTGERLAEMETQDATKFNQIKYYFTQSFSVEKVSCPGCPIDYDIFFNYDLFDVATFESLRENQNQNSFLFKDGQYEITLLSKDEVETQLGGIPIESVLSLRYMRPFPQWLDSGGDFVIYKEAIQSWAIDFKEEYRVMTSSPGFLKMRLDDFLSLSEERQNRLIHSPGGYMIIE